MTDQLTDNELIAEFMGFKHCKTYGPLTGEEYTEVKQTSNAAWQIARWHASWDWLMPVVEKIEAMDENMAVVINRNSAHVQYVTHTHHSTIKIDAVYKAVVEFIKWHNQQKP